MQYISCTESLVQKVFETKIIVFDICLLENKCVTPVYMSKTSLLGTFVPTAGKVRENSGNRD